MNFDYQRVGATTANTKNITLLQLAVNVVTDWMPGVPDSMALGFTDLLNNVIKSEPGFLSEKWFIRESVGGFEKQWKQNTSWILGVAFCRHIIELEGYRWWAPVSAFTFQHSDVSVDHPYWMEYLKTADCYIESAGKSYMNLLPDYVLARGNSSKWEISFVESKGTSKSLTGSNMPSSAWVDQSKNAKFYWKGHYYPATQDLLIATRVNPNAKREETRLIKVRAWNNFEPKNEVPTDALHPLLVIHYFGVCQRIGLENNAKLLAVKNLLREIDNKIYKLKERTNANTEIYSQYKLRRELDELHRKQDEIKQDSEGLERIADEEVNTVITDYNLLRMDNNPSMYYQNTRRQFFTIGDQRISIGLSQIAMDTVRWLQGRNPEFSLANFERWDAFLAERNQSEGQFVIRRDGILGERVS